MSGIYNSLASVIDAKVGTRGLHKRSKHGAAPILQILTKPMLWDWSVPSKGSMNSEVYNFCDKIPTNFKSEVYTPGAASFSRNYYSFLQSIQDTDTFPLAADLKSTLSINNPSPPIYPAAGGIIPKYWSVVNYTSSVNDVQRAYEVSEYPSSWIAHAVGGGLARELNLVDSSTGLLLDKNGRTIADSAAAGVKFGYTARAWSTINIAVKNWYLGAVVSVVKSNKNSYSTLDRRSIFGPNGLIPCRVASFIVALDPQPYVDIDTGMSDIIADIDSVGSVAVGGLNFSQGGEAENSLGANFTTTNISDSQKQIRGTTGASKNQAYIIAVQLQRI